MVSPAERKRRKRERLFRAQHGKCHWCGKPMVIRSVANSSPSRKIQMPDDTATFEHLDSRLNPNRGRYENSGVKRIVLACFRCNVDRGAAEEAALGTAELTRRAQAAHAEKHRQCQAAYAPGWYMD